MSKKITRCRLCFYGNLSLPYLDLGLHPISNELNTIPDQQAERFPLQVVQCVEEDCGAYQLNYSIEGERLFQRDYTFVTSTSPTNVLYFQQYAIDVAFEAKLKTSNFVVEIASNDGCVLNNFKNSGCRVLGIDPATNIAAIANQKGIETIPDFFTENLAEEIVTKYGQADLVCANNCLAHIDNIEEVGRGIKKLLKPGGTLVFENSYFKKVVEDNLFDTIYLEHKSYFLITPFISFFNKLGMTVYNAYEVSPHGGSIRIFVKNAIVEPTNNLQLYLKEEILSGLVNSNPTSAISLMNEKINHLKQTLTERLEEIRETGGRVVAFGSPAKAVTLFHTLKLTDGLIDACIEENPLKVGKYLPGTNIPIVGSDYLYKEKPDFVLVLAWNFFDNIYKRHKNYREDGRWIVPLPEYKEILP